MYVSTNFLCSSFQDIESPSRDVHLGAIDGETFRNSLTEAGPATSNYDHLAFDGKEVLDLERDMLVGCHSDRMDVENAGRWT